MQACLLQCTGLFVPTGTSTYHAQQHSKSKNKSNCNASKCSAMQTACDASTDCRGDGHAVQSKQQVSVTSLLFAARANASCAENVLLPTPPFPDSTKILCLMFRMRCSMAMRSGSGPLGAVAHISWFGQPAQAADLPALSLLVPGQSARTSTLGLQVHHARLSSCRRAQAAITTQIKSTCG